MQGIPPIKAVMTPFPYSIQRDASIDAAKQMMKRHAIRHLPVMEGPELVGVITDRDIALVLEPALGQAAEGTSVGDICSTELYVVELNEPLDRVLSRMAERHIGSTLVVKQGRLAGILTVTDVCRLYADRLRSLFPPSDDREPA